MPTNLPTSTTVKELQYIDRLSDLLDTRFRIPFTSIRFGVDFLIGLVPYAGDVVSFGISGGMVLAMARHGVSGWVLIRMLWNVFLDATIGAIPIIGDLFDLAYKANVRNLNLLKKHYVEEEDRGSAWKAILTVAIALIVLFLLLLFMIYKVIVVIVSYIGSL